METEVLYDEIEHLAPYFTTNKSTKVKGTVTNSETSRYFERLTKYDRFKYLLKELDSASLTVCDEWFHKLGPLITKEHFVCVFVCGCTRAHARVHACVFTCMRRLCVFACMCVCDCVCVFVYVCARDFPLRSVSLNNKVLFLKNYICYPSRATFGKCYHYNSF